MANAERLKQVRAYLGRHPESIGPETDAYSLSLWFFDAARILAGHRADGCNLLARVREWLDLTKYEYDLLDNRQNTEEDLWDHIEVLAAGYGGDGFNCHGRDRFGVDREGYRYDGRYVCARRQRGGRDEHGYDKEGFGRDGYDHDGFDRENKPRPA